jgi:hypothetical protein
VSPSPVLTPYRAPYQRIIRQTAPVGTLTNQDREELKGVTEEINKLRDTITARTNRGETHERN